MTENSKKYSFAAGWVLLIACLTYAYYMLVDPLKSVAYSYTDKGYFKYLLEMYSSKEHRITQWTLTIMTVALLVLAIGMFRQSKLLLLVGTGLDLVLLAYQVHLMGLGKVDSEWWDSFHTLGFINTIVVPAIVVLMLLLMAVALMLNKPVARIFAIVAIALAGLGFLVELVLNIGPLVSETWMGRDLFYSFSPYARYTLTEIGKYTTPISYLTRAGIGAMIALWGMECCKASKQK
ncbi:MAG: hypothetical protein J6Y10_01630 [Lachnospiraceae bacterium]|nr:hypothetical protein [Lachnospiraceae bacterium]